MVAAGGGGKFLSGMDGPGPGLEERQGQEPMPDFSTVEQNKCQAAGGIIPGLPPLPDRGMDAVDLNLHNFP